MSAATARASAGRNEGVWCEVDERPVTTLGYELRRRGLDFPEPGELADDELPEVLWRLIRCLAVLHVFLRDTDRLGDRALYERLWRDELRRLLSLPAQTADMAVQLDIAPGAAPPGLGLGPTAGAGRVRRAADRDRFLPQRDELRLRFVRARAGSAWLEG